MTYVGRWECFVFPHSKWYVNCWHFLTMTVYILPVFPSRMYMPLKSSVLYIKAPFTLRSIFGTVPVFWFLDYLNSNQKSDTGTNFIRAYQKLSVV
jgi:hypothetical protein